MVYYSRSKASTPIHISMALFCNRVFAKHKTHVINVANNKIENWQINNKMEEKSRRPDFHWKLFHAIRCIAISRYLRSYFRRVIIAFVCIITSFLLWKKMERVSVRKMNRLQLCNWNEWPLPGYRNVCIEIRFIRSLATARKKCIENAVNAEIANWMLNL